MCDLHVNILFDACCEARCKYVRIWANGMQWELGSGQFGTKFLEYVCTQGVCLPDDSGTWPQTPQLDIALNYHYGRCSDGWSCLPVFTCGGADTLAPLRFRKEDDFKGNVSETTMFPIYGCETAGTVRVRVNTTDVSNAVRKWIERGADFSEALDRLKARDVMHKLEDENLAQAYRDETWLVQNVSKAKVYNGSVKHYLNNFLNSTRQKHLTDDSITTYQQYRDALETFKTVLRVMREDQSCKMVDQTTRFEVTFTAILSSPECYINMTKLLFKHQQSALRIQMAVRIAHPQTPCCIVPSLCAIDPAIW